MIDPNKGASQNLLDRLREGSYERFHTQLLEAIETLLNDFEMDWDDLAEKLHWPLSEYRVPIRYLTGQEIKQIIGDDLSSDELNDIAAAFSAEPYIIFRPRFPWIEKKL